MSGNTGLAFMAALGAALLLGMVWGVKLENSAWKRTEQAKRGKLKPVRLSTSKLIALGVLAVDASCTYIVLYLCWLSIQLQFSGSLPYLTALIGALQAATAVVLSGYFYKSGKENTKGGITYDAALGKTEPDIFDTV